MKIAIIGSGATGLFLSIMIKKFYPNNEVTVIEKNKKIAKKLYATGNGKCNIGNKVILAKNDNHYNISQAYDIISTFDFTSQKAFLKELGFLTKENGTLSYPTSESAKAFVDGLIEVSTHLGVNFILETELKDYSINNQKVYLKTNPQINNNVYDRVVFTTGGASAPKMGTDGSIFEILKSHYYHVTLLEPGLCPLVTKEKTKAISGNRLKVTASLLIDDEILYKERGEVLFKDNGLSGICIMNIASIIARYHQNNHICDAKIILNVLDGINFKDLSTIIDINRKAHKPLLTGIFNEAVGQYFGKRINEKMSNRDIYDYLKNITFNYSSHYGFEDSQVTVGGVSIEEVDKTTLKSYREKEIFFGGEVLNIDGLCGGLNLMYCIASAYIIAKHIN